MTELEEMFCVHDLSIMFLEERMDQLLCVHPQSVQEVFVWVRSIEVSHPYIVALVCLK